MNRYGLENVLIIPYFAYLDSRSQKIVLSWDVIFNKDYLVKFSNEPIGQNSMVNNVPQKT